MKIVKVQGGLSNQLFCVAFAHSVGVLAGSPVSLDIGGYPRDRYGNDFLLQDLAASLGQMKVSRHPLLGGRILGAAMRRLPVPGYVSESHAPRDTRALERMARRGVYFNGYWQAEAYIARPDRVRRGVRAFLDGRGGAAERRQVLIHYRTYRDEIHPDRRGSPGAAFVRRALEAIEARRGPTDDIVLISDDPDLAMERLGELGRRITPVATGDRDKDMALMLHAGALILSNSSYAWWGGFCGDAEMVIYPKRGDLYHYPLPAARFTCV